MVNYKRQNFYMLFDAIDDYAAVIDSNGTILEVNKALLSQFGYTKTELIGKSLSMIYRTQSQTDFSSTLKQIFEGELTDFRVILSSKEKKEFFWIQKQF